MPQYTSTADITPRIGGRPLDATNPPTLNDVTAWLNQAEAELQGTLQSVGIGWTYSGSSNGALTIQLWVANYVAGLARRSWAAAAGDGRNPDGLQEITDWKDRIRDIKMQPSIYAALLSATGSVSGTVQPSSNFTQGLATLANPSGTDTPAFRINTGRPDEVL